MWQVTAQKYLFTLSHILSHTHTLLHMLSHTLFHIVTLFFTLSLTHTHTHSISLSFIHINPKLFQIKKLKLKTVLHCLICIQIGTQSCICISHYKTLSFWEFPSQKSLIFFPRNSGKGMVFSWLCLILQYSSYSLQVFS